MNKYLKAARKFLKSEVNIRNDSDAKAIYYWLRERFLCKNSITTYRVVTFRFWLWLKYNKLSLKSLNRKQIIDYLEFLKSPDPDWCGTSYKFNKEWHPFKKKLSIRAMRHNMQLLKQMCTELAEMGYLDKNPFYFKIRIPNIIHDYGIDRYITKDEYRNIQSHIDTLPEHIKIRKEIKIRTKWIFSLLLYSACRRSEICQATMDNFHYQQNRLWLRVFGKGGKYGDIPVSQSFEHSLNEYRKFYHLVPISDKFRIESLYH